MARLVRIVGLSRSKATDKSDYGVLRYGPPRNMSWSVYPHLRDTTSNTKLKTDKKKPRKRKMTRKLATSAEIRKDLLEALDRGPLPPAPDKVYGNRVFKPKTKGSAYTSPKPKRRKSRAMVIPKQVRMMLLATQGENNVATNDSKTCD